MNRQHTADDARAFVADFLAYHPTLLPEAARYIDEVSVMARTGGAWRCVWCDAPATVPVVLVTTPLTFGGPKQCNRWVDLCGDCYELTVQAVIVAKSGAVLHFTV